VLDRDRRRFQLHALLREQARTSCGAGELENLQQSHAAALEQLLKDWETRWQDCCEWLPEVLPAVNFLGERKESARQTRVTYNGFAVANRIGELDEAHRILKQEESFYAGRTDREALGVLNLNYGNQAVILQAWGRLEEALALHKQQEAICLELGNKCGLGYCYWQWARLARKQGDKQAERQRMDQAFALFTELKMPRERDAVRAELDKTDGA
jgi:tetratricopeptide (TPR) repeat protein